MLNVGNLSLIHVKEKLDKRSHNHNFKSDIFQ